MSMRSRAGAFFAIIIPSAILIYASIYVVMSEPRYFLALARLLASAGWRVLLARRASTAV
jgi:hypothetical protein